MAHHFINNTQDAIHYLLDTQPELLKQVVTEAVDEFYSRSAENPELKIILDRLGKVRFEKLKAEQIAHSLLLLRSDQESFLEVQARNIGKIHALMGIQSEWIISSTVIYGECLLKHLDPLFENQPQLRGHIFQRLGLDLARQLQGMESASDAERMILNEIDLRLISELSPAQSIQHMVDKLMEIPGLAGAWMGQSEDGIHLQFHAASHTAMQEYLSRIEIRLDDSPLGQGPAGKAWRSGQIIYVDDWQSSPHTRPWQDASQKYSWRSNVTIPIQVNGASFAIIALYSNVPGFFSNSRRQNIIHHLAVMLGITIERQRQQAQIDRLNSLYRASLAVSDILIRARSEAEILRKTCQHIVEGTLFKVAYVVRPDVNGRFRALASAGSGHDILGRLHIYLQPDTSSLLCDTWQSQRLHYSNDYLRDPRLSAQHTLMKQQGWSSVITIPIQRNGQIWGVLGITSHEKQIFDQEMLRALARVAKLLGYGLDEMDFKEQIDQERARQSWMARHDALTKLPNRIALLDRIPEAVKRAHRDEKLMVVGMLDLDDFKPVNDHHGHAAGDALLRLVGTRLEQVLRQTDCVARVGGDEFALVIENIRNMDEMEKMLLRIGEALQRPYLLPGNIVAEIGGSLGITVYPFDDGDSEILLRHADQALYIAKRNKTGRSQFWASFQGDEQASETFHPHRTLFHKKNSLIAYYQPILQLSTGHIIGFEALARLRDGQKILSPDQFLSHLNHDDLKTLTIQMLQLSIKTAQHLKTAGYNLEFAINIPPEIFLNENCIADIRSILDESDMEPTHLTLEILEDGDFLSMHLAQEKIAALRSLGVRIALDDVGSAYASLLRLRELAVDEVKLDQGLVREIANRPSDLIFVGSVAALAMSMKARYVVEGVETPEILDALAVIGVDCVQGYAIARPMSETELLPWLQSWHPKPQDNQPNTLLGAYASHLQFDSLYQLAPAILGQLPHLDDAHRCRLGKYLDSHELEETPLALAHQKYHACISRPHTSEELSIHRSAVQQAMASIHDHLQKPHVL